MKLLNSDFKKGYVKIEVNNSDDLWFLSNIIDEGDSVTGKTTRKIKKGEKEESVKKTFTLTVKVEKIDFSKSNNELRVLGSVENEIDDIPKGSHHSIEINENSIIKIEKEKWLKFQIEKIKEAGKDEKLNVLILVLERDEACFALLRKYGYEYLGEIEGKVEKKAIKDKIKEKDFYLDVLEKLEDYVKRHKIEYIILASPAFWKDDFMDLLKKKNNDLSKKVTLATCNAFGKNGINELLKRDEVRKVLKQDRVIKETNLVEDLMYEISKGDLGAYGIKEVEETARMGAIKELLICDKFIIKMRQDNKYYKLEEIMNLVEKSKGEIHIISSEHDGGKRLNGLGGIGAILRYNVNK